MHPVFFFIGDGGEEHGGMGGDHEAGGGFEEDDVGDDKGVEHEFAGEEVAHPFGEDGVHYSLVLLLLWGDGAVIITSSIIVGIVICMDLFVIIILQIESKLIPNTLGQHNPLATP